jgi:hypothetical protein
MGLRVAGVVILLCVPAFAQEVRLLNGFNTEEDLKLFTWSTAVKVELVREHATEGQGAAKVTFPGDIEYAGFAIPQALLAGWDRFDRLTLDIFNPGDEVVSVVLRIDDDRSKGGDEWATWYNGSFKVFPGANRVEVPLHALSAYALGRLNLADLRKFSLWTAPVKEKVLYFDAVALRKFETAKLPAKLRAFDFGPATSPVQPGFTSVDEKVRFSEERGYGFVGEAQLTSAEDHPRTGEPLGCDSVVGKEGVPLTFAVNLPDGHYRLWAATGYAHPWNWPRRPYTVTVGSKELFRYEPPSLNPRDCRDCLERDYTRNGDLWAMFVVGHLFDEFEGDIEVTGGTLELTVASRDTGPRIRGLAIWPADDAACAKAMVEVQASRRAGFARKWRELTPAVTTAPFAFSPEEAARGFLLARCNALELVTPYFVPAAGDRLAKISIAAAAGQYEPAPFIVYPSTDIPGCEVSVSDLRGPAGTVAASSVRVYTVQYRYCREGEDAYSVKPVHLAPRSRVDLEARVSREFWMSVFVPEDAKPGEYAGTATVSAGGRTASVPLEVEVYPFRLDKPEDHGYVYAHVSAIPSDAAAIEADLRCLKQHGSNSVTPAGVIGPNPTRREGKLSFDFAKLDMLMEAMKRVGMTGPVPLFDMSVQGEAGGKSYPHIGFLRNFGYPLESQQYLDDVTELTRQLIARASEKAYLPVLMYPSTEISNDPHVGPAFNSKIIAAMRKAGKVECVSSINTPADIDTAKELDYTMINFGVGITEETLMRLHSSGTKLWFQNVGQTRYADGLFLLRAGAVGRRQWVANFPDCDPYSDWDGHDSTSLIFPSPVGTLASVRLEWMHMGVDDLRYFLTLKRLIEEARKAGAVGAADEAQKAYDEMIASCPIQLAGGSQVMPDGLSVIDGFADKDTFDRYRRRTADEIMKLQQVLAQH